MGSLEPMSIGTHHVKRMYSDPEYWRNYSIQERNINKLFMSTVDLARRIDKGTLSMIDFGIQLGSLQRMFHQSTGIFYFPQLETHELHQLHGITMGIPSLSDSIFKCEPVPGQLFTNQHGGPPDWVALPEGSKASESATIELAKGENYDDPDESDELSKPRPSRLTRPLWYPERQGSDMQMLYGWAHRTMVRGNTIRWTMAL